MLYLASESEYPEEICKKLQVQFLRFNFLYLSICGLNSTHEFRIFSTRCLRYIATMHCDIHLPKRLTFAKYRIVFANFFSGDISQVIRIVDNLVAYENLISIVVQKSVEIDLVETKRLGISATSVSCQSSC